MLLQNAGGTRSLEMHFGQGFMIDAVRPDLRRLGLRRNWKNEERLKILNAWRQSSMTRKEFCAKHGISISALDNWRKKLEGKETQETQGLNSSIELVEIPLEGGSAKPSGRQLLRIITSYGAVIEVPL